MTIERKQVKSGGSRTEEKVSVGLRPTFPSYLTPLTAAYDDRPPENFFQKSHDSGII
jgi:hypothetical protein